MKTLLCFLLTLSAFGTAAGFTAPDSFAYSSRFQMALGGGYTASSGDFHTGERTDHLLGFRKQNSLIDYINLAWFPWKHWGVTLNVGSRFFSNDSASAAFGNSITEQYGTDYFSDYKDLKSGGGDMVDFRIGLVYRYEHRRWKVNLSGSVGGTIFSTLEVDFHLKKRKEHEELLVSYIPSKGKGYACFTLSLAARAAYTLHKNIGVYAEVRPSFFNASFSYKETIKNQITGQQSERHISYKETVFLANFSAGLTFFFGHKKKQGS